MKKILVITVIAAQEETVTYTYDAAGRLSSEVLDVHDGGAGNQTTTYSYDDHGRLARKVVAAETSVTTSYRYDGDGNLVEKVVEQAGAAPARTRYTYDVAALRRWRAEAPWRVVRR